MPCTMLLPRSNNTRKAPELDTLFPDILKLKSCKSFILVFYCVLINIVLLCISFSSTNITERYIHFCLLFTEGAGFHPPTVVHM